MGRDDDLGSGRRADATEEEGTRQSEAILAKYGIDADDYWKAMEEMMTGSKGGEGETPATEHGCTTTTRQIAAAGDSCWTFGDFYAEFGDRIVKRKSGEDDPAAALLGT